MQMFKRQLHEEIKDRHTGHALQLPPSFSPVQKTVIAYLPPAKSLLVTVLSNLRSLPQGFYRKYSKRVLPKQVLQTKGGHTSTESASAMF